ncbi:MAG TPA: InlB B-repeat-containing protein, partial [Paludibacter sp.]|nr:InlB B-repeat-containing protein [Paludibacter sp.]
MKKLIGEWSRLIIGIVTVVLAIITIGCNSSKGNNNALLALLGLISPPPAASYTVTYDDNVSTSGSVPTDSNTYTAGATVIILGNTGTLAKTGFTFAGWNTKADGSGTTYSQGQHCTMGTANLILYARWTTQPTYTVTYNGNLSTGGSALIDTTNYTTGQTITVFDQGTLVRAGYTFNGWNTASNGSGTSYTATQTFSMGSAN